MKIGPDFLNIQKIKKTNPEIGYLIGASEWNSGSVIYYKNTAIINKHYKSKKNMYLSCISSMDLSVPWRDASGSGPW